MALGLAILMLGGMLMTMFSMFDYYGTRIEESEKWDARLYFSPDAYPKISKEINENGAVFLIQKMKSGIFLKSIVFYVFHLFPRSAAEMVK